MDGRKSVLFVHPDLGLGGAERLVVDCATCLRSLGHQTCVYTAHYDPARCFPEVAPGGSVPVQVVGSWIPRKLFGRFQAFLTAVQCAFIALYACLVRRDAFDVVVCDIVTLPLVVFRLFGKPCVFYCHFPDKLLAESLRVNEQSETPSPLRRAYRRAVDLLEEYPLRYAETILVNSLYTATMFQRAFPRIRRQPVVLYPTLPPVPAADAGQDRLGYADGVGYVIVSLNRFERKKRIDLAILVLAALRHHVPEEIFRATKLVVAGGWDSRLRENVEYESELRELARSGIQDSVVFRRNVTDSERRQLMARCHCVLYTPPNEHFGIVPLEAMAEGKPVIACNSGGPTETIQHGVTGYLCSPEPEEFAAAAARLLLDPGAAKRMGASARARVETHFGRTAFAQRLEAAIQTAAATPGSHEQRPGPRKSVP